jgi:hypothetical protein
MMDINNNYAGHYHLRHDDKRGLKGVHAVNPAFEDVVSMMPCFMHHHADYHTPYN